MSFLFEKPKTTKEVVRDQKRSIQHNQRDIDREILTLEREEKKCVLEIKKLAKQGQNASAKLMAKELVRIRNQKTKLMGMKSKLSGVSVQMTTMQANESVAKAMGGATRAMAATNARVPVQQMQNTMMQFEKQNEIASMREEMMDDMFDDEELDEQADEEVNAVLDSIGLDVSEQMSRAKTGSSVPGQRQKVSNDDIDKLLASMPSVQQ